MVNADALQVFDGWRILTARPTPSEVAQTPHALYGHVNFAAHYSVGEWLRDLAPLLNRRTIIVGGTGLYFRALTEGLAEVPPVPEIVRIEAQQRLEAEGLSALLTELDSESLRRIDTQNPVRVARAWEVQRATGQPLHVWQDDTPAPLLPLAQCMAVLLDAPKDWLNPRIEQRFDHMLKAGALEEARANLPGWDPMLPAARAIGAAELIAHINGELTLAQTRDAAVLATRQYAKRQRTWFRTRMKAWTHLSAEKI